MKLSSAKKFLTRFFYFMAVCLVCFAVLVNVARIFLPKLSQGTRYLESWASSVVGQPVRIVSVRATWRGFLDPVISFSGVEFLNEDHKKVLLHVSHLEIGVDVFHSIMKKSLFPSSFSLDGLNLDVVSHKTSGFFIEGLSFSKGELSSRQSDFSKEDLFYWLLMKSNISIKNVHIRWHESNGQVIIFNNAGVEIKNNAFGHYLAGEMSIEGRVKSQLKFIVNFNHFDNDWHNVSADAYIKANNVSLSELGDQPWFKSYLHAYQLKSGVINMQVWSKIRNSQLVSIKSKLLARDLNIYLNVKKQELKFNKAKGDVFWQKEDKGWRLIVDKLDVAWGNEHWLENKLALEVFPGDSTSKATQTFFIDSGSVKGIYQLADHLSLLPKKIKSWFDKIRPSGRFNQLIYSRVLTGSGVWNNFIKANFNDFSMRGYGKIPSFSGLSAEVYFSPNRGYVSVKNHAVSFNYPYLFENKFYFNDFYGLFSWRRSGVGWKMQVKNLLLNDKNVGLTLNANVYIPKKGSPIVDMISGVHLSDLAKIGDYLPVHHMSKTLKYWLSDAFYTGQMRQGILVLRGPLLSFPYRHHQGHFEGLSNLTNIDLLYAKNWPIIKNMDAILSFNDAGMKARLMSGSIGGVKILRVDGSIPSLSSGSLFVKGHMQGDMSEGLNFINHSPMTLKKQLEGIEMSGPMKLSLALAVPLHTQKTTVSTKGVLSLIKTQLNMPAWNINLSNIVGNLRFTNKGLYARELGAKLFNYPANVEITTISNKKHRREVRIHLNSRVNMEDLYKTYLLPVLHYAKGVTHYNALLLLHEVGDVSGNSLSVSSALKGVSWDFPSPYVKKSASSIPFVFTMHAGGESPLLFGFNYGNKLSAKTLFKRQQGQYRFWGGNLLLGPGQAKLPDLSNWVIHGHVKQVNWPVWKKFLAGFSALEKKLNKANKNTLNKVLLTIDKLSIFDRLIDNVRLVIKPFGVAGYNVNIVSKKISGTIKLPSNEEITPIVANLEHFYYVPNNKSRKSLKPSDFDPIKLSIDNFFYKNNLIGSLALQIVSSPKALQIKNAVMQSKDYRLNLSGNWKTDGHGQYSFVSGKLDTKDLGKVLSSFGLTDMLAKGEGTADFSLSWPKAPYDFGLGISSGNFSIDFHHGRILNLSDETESELGLGKLLGLLSLQSLSQKLLLNFGSLTNKGFPFDNMNAHFQLQNGKARTNNFIVNGSVAKVRAMGTLNFVNKVYNLSMTVQPYLTSSLPVIAAIAGTPIIGAATWIVNKVILAPLAGKAAESRYKLQGSWAKSAAVNLPKPK